MGIAGAGTEEHEAGTAPPPSVRHFESPLLSRSKPAFDNLICGLYHSSVALGFRGRASGWDLGILLIMASVTRMLAIKV